MTRKARRGEMKRGLGWKMLVAAFLLAGPASAGTTPQTTQPLWGAPAVNRPQGTKPVTPTWQGSRPSVTFPATKLSLPRGTRGTNAGQQERKSTAAPVEKTRKKGRFRVTLSGFHIFAVKGIRPPRGHTYYAAAKVLKYSQWGAILSHETKKTRLIGHRRKFPSSIKGGTATPNGGFRNGDVYPGSPPYMALSAYPDRLPLLVWEGVLEEGGDVLVVEPTLWEKRNGEDIFRVWHEQFPSQITELQPCLPGAYGENWSLPLLAWTQEKPTPMDDLISARFDQYRACVEITPREIFRPLGRNKPDVVPGFSEKDRSRKPRYTDPHGFLLNYRLAEKIAGEEQTEPVLMVKYESRDLEVAGISERFPESFVRANERTVTVLPAGGIQPFWFASEDVRHIAVQQAAGAAAFFSAGIAHPIIPDRTAIELYLKIQKLSL